MPLCLGSQFMSVQRAPAVLRAESGHNNLQMHLLYFYCLGLVAHINALSKSLNHGVDLSTTRPLNIAHRGSSGMLPEHTIEAYKLAIAQGADVIECDMCITKDLQVVCIHESNLNKTTDVWTKFSQKATTRYINATRGAAAITDVFSVDLTLAEVKTLRVKQRYPFRDPGKNFQYSIPTLQEFLDIAKAAGRPLGIYPEIKTPHWVNSLDIMRGKRFEDLVLKILQRYGYTKKTQPCFVQSFEEESLKYMSTKTQLPLVMLIWDEKDDVSNEKLADWSKFCYGIGPWKQTVLEVQNHIIKEKTDLVQRAHNYGLKVHPYTFRNEYHFLAWDYGQDPYKEYDMFIRELGVDGIFTDFPHSFKFYLDANFKLQTSVGCSISFDLHIRPMLYLSVILYMLWI